MVIAIGFEGSANKLGIGIMYDNIMLSNKRCTFIPPTGEGFRPRQVELHHRENILALLKNVLIESKLSIHQIDVICFTSGPGMGTPLSTVAFVARLLACIYKKPVIAVNHCVAHIEMGRFISGAKNPVSLYVSGGNTQIIIYHNKRYMICGETLDIAIGNCIDRFARVINVSNDPAPGYNIEKMAKKGIKYIKLPYVVKGMDVSFSGILSYSKDFLLKMIDSGKITKEDACFSLQETIFSMLVEITERAMANVNSKEVILVGGVGCNERLQQMMNTMALDRGAISYSSDEKYCIDNGLMIAKTGQLMFESGVRHLMKNTGINQRFRTDDVEIVWRE